jgi:hypothetical protein
VHLCFQKFSEAHNTYPCLERGREGQERRTKERGEWNGLRRSRGKDGIIEKGEVKCEGGKVGEEKGRAIGSKDLGHHLLRQVYAYGISMYSITIQFTKC